MPWIMLLIGVGAGAFLLTLGRALHGYRSPSRDTLSLGALWAACSVSLFAIFATQEFLEGVFATGYPSGLAGISGFGGWWSIPAAVCVGLVLAGFFRGARWVLDELAQRARATNLAPRTRVAPPPHPLDLRLPRLAPLAGGWSGRGPPR